ncbi:MAG TPA: FMN-binding protein [Gemmatimonadetes bacterium]|nr:FMN-binding protein [Gemmatimonadota bacterium]
MAVLNPVRVAAFSIAAVAWAAPIPAQTLTQDEALALAFPGAQMERRTAFLDDAQLTRASALAGPDVDVESVVVTYYVALRDGEPVAVAYFDAGRVRTLPQVLMIVLDPDARVTRIETVSFREPPEYRAPNGWLQQFFGRALNDDLSLKGEIANITGATLTAGAVTRATRRVLALHAIVDPFGAHQP